MAQRSPSDQARRFGPLTGLAVAAGIAFLVLPSALTLPNPTPSAQEEVAPVPATASKLNPPVSNFTSLSSGTNGDGLGAGNGPGGAATPGAAPTTPALALPPPPKLPPGVGNTPPATFQCVAGRQTEDPLSPTCVPFFQGDNGGETYQGVSAKEVRILIYFDPYGTLNTSQGASTPPYNTIIDVDAPPKDREHPSVYTMRGWEKFFGTRYAAYDRHVHIFVQFGTFDSAGNETPGTQAQDAALGYAKVKPFAVVNFASFGNGAFYDNYMAQHSVLNFGSVSGRSESFYKQFAGKQWGYPPPLEYSAAQYADFVCTSLKDQKASDVGQGSVGIANGTPRKYGYLYTTDPAFEGITTQAKISRDLIKKQCGITGIEATYDHNSYSVDSSRTPQYALNIAVQFQQAGITTVLWPAGYEDKISMAMNSANYFPEFILGDDDQQASNFGASFQDKNVWAHAWIVSSQTYDPAPNERVCAQEYRTVDQTSANSDVQSFACDYYNDLRQLYTGIQVAGPNLTPESLDQGFHAIPVVLSTNPQLPTCYYNAGDYTCVKDSVVEHYDGAAQTSSATPGCWRMVGGGKRYVPGTFPKANLDAMKNPQDVCNNFSKSVNLNTGPPTP